LSFDTTSKSHRAVQLILEPIAAELFVLRVQNDKRHRYEQNLADLRIAKQLDPTNPEVLQMLAETLAKCGETDRALETVTQVLELAPGNVGLMLHKARSTG
jgi:cytochrome c-type biogenesis protein CcmH/NrfG